MLQLSMIFFLTKSHLPHVKPSLGSSNAPLNMQELFNFYNALHMMISFISEFPGSQKGSCKLLLSDTHTHQGDSPRFHFIYKKWIHTTFTIKGWFSISALSTCIFHIRHLKNEMCYFLSCISISSDDIH